MRTGDRERERLGIDRRSVLQSVGGAGALGLGSAGALGGVSGRISTLESDEAPTARGSVEQVAVFDAEAGATVTLYGPDDEEVAEATADDFGSYLFEDIEPVLEEGDPVEAYQVTQTVDDDESPRSEAVRVLPTDYVPPQELYDDQELDEGFGYIETRDGTTLACQVLLPDDFEPPYPTLILVDGYEPSVNIVGGDTIPDVVVGEFGYAVVGLNLRGTTCSGGRFSLGEPIQGLDGYDAVETVATQEWSEGDVALVGASFSGFSQLYVGATQPPSLKAIAPGAPIGEFYRDTVYPGGMRNQTFAQVWAGDRDSEYEPGGSDGNVDDKIEAGDEICEQNQRLRLQNDSMVEQLQENEFADGIYEERGLIGEFDLIEVPLFLVISWQDEQTGGRAARLFEELGDIPARFIGTNGDHFEYISQNVLDRLNRFLYYYLREEIPPEDEAEFDTFEDALTAYEAEDPVVISWERDQSAVPRAETRHSDWPPAEADTWEQYFQPDGTLASDPPEVSGTEATRYAFSPRSPFVQLVSRDNDRLQWEAQDDGTYVAFTSDPLTEDHTILGTGSVELWLRSSEPDTDLQVTLSEIRPDGQEMFVQTGWLRAGHRAEDKDFPEDFDPVRADERRPWHTHREADYDPLPDDEFARMRVELFPVGHVFREGSQVRIAIETPGGNRDLWGFNLLGQATNEVAHSETYPGKVSLPLLPDADVGLPNERPDCGSVRHQPCRPAETPERGTVSGTVTDRDGPVEDIELQFLPEDSTTGRTTSVGEEGSYSTTLEAGEYTVSVPGETVSLPGETDSAPAVTITADETTTLDVEIEPPIPPIADGLEAPRDRDGDGLFEDVNGDGDLDMADVQVLFDNLRSETVIDNAEVFNFSGTNPDRVTIFDVQALFTRAQQE